MLENSENIEKVILVGVCLDEKDDTKDSIEELEDLVKTAGAVTVAKVIQNREKIHPGTYVGKGKIDLEEYQDVDFLSISAHKFYGPKGIGCVFIRKDQNGFFLKITPAENRCQHKIFK